MKITIQRQYHITSEKWLDLCKHIYVSIKLHRLKLRRELNCSELLRSRMLVVLRFEPSLSRWVTKYWQWNQSSDVKQGIMHLPYVILIPVVHNIEWTRVDCDAVVTFYFGIYVLSNRLLSMHFWLGKMKKLVHVIEFIFTWNVGTQYYMGLLISMVRRKVNRNCMM